MGGVCPSRSRQIGEASSLSKEAKDIQCGAKPQQQPAEPATAAPTSVSNTCQIDGSAVDDGQLLEEEEQEPAPRRSLCRNACRHCWDVPGKMICRRCNRVKYCSQDCQKSHWQVHRQLCGKEDLELREAWIRLRKETRKDGNLARHHEFIRHVAPDFWYTKNGHQIIQSLVVLGEALPKPSKATLIKLEYMFDDAFELGADVNAACDTGDTALHMAVKYGSKVAELMVRKLLEHPDVDVKKTNSEGETAEALCKATSFKKLFSQTQETRTQAREAREQQRKLAEEQRLEEQKKWAEEKLEVQKKIDAAREQEEQKAKQERLDDLKQKRAAFPRKRCCRECWKPGVSICRRCNRVMYCSAECQKANWGVHSQFCGKPGEKINTLWTHACARAIEEADVEECRVFFQHVGADFNTATSRNVSQTIANKGQEDVMHSLVMMSQAMGRNNEEYIMRLDKSDGSTLGLDLQLEGTGLLIVRAVSGGLAGAWNVENPRRAMQPGDGISEINNIRDDNKGMIEELKKNQPLVFKCITPTRVRSRFAQLLRDAVDFGAEINIANEDGNTLLHALCSKVAWFSTGEGERWMTKWLIENAPIDVLAKNLEGKTALDCLLTVDEDPETTPLRTVDPDSDIARLLMAKVAEAEQLEAEQLLNKRLAKEAQVEEAALRKDKAEELVRGVVAENNVRFE